MERCDVVTFAYHLLDSIVDEYAGVEFLSAVDHAVAYGVDFVKRSYAAVFCADEVVEYRLYGSFMVYGAELLGLLGPVGELELQHPVLEADAFHSALGHDAACGGVYEFVFD